MRTTLLWMAHTGLVACTQNCGRVAAFGKTDSQKLFIFKVLRNQLLRYIHMSIPVITLVSKAVM